MTEKDAQILFKKFILEIVSESKILNQKLSLLGHMKLYSWVSNLSEQDLLSIVINGNILSESEKKPPKLLPHIRKILELGFAAACIATPGGFFLFAAAVYIRDAYNYRCGLNCRNDKEDKKYCYAKCNVDSTRKLVKLLESELRKCKYEPIEKDRKKCFKRMEKLTLKWKVKKSEAEVDLKYETGRFNRSIRRR
jgi:hypothetical protein